MKYPIDMQKARDGFYREDRIRTELQKLVKSKAYFTKFFLFISNLAYYDEKIKEWQLAVADVKDTHSDEIVPEFEKIVDFYLDKWAETFQGTLDWFHDWIDEERKHKQADHLE